MAVGRTNKRNGRGIRWKGEREIKGQRKGRAWIKDCLNLKDIRIKGLDCNKGKRREEDKYGKGIEERGIKVRKKDGSSNNKPTTEENSKSYHEKFRHHGDLTPGICAGIT